MSPFAHILLARKDGPVLGVVMNMHASRDFAEFRQIDPVDRFTGFPVGTRVRTEHGERSIETLVAGDRVITRHGKLVTVTSVSLDSGPDSGTGIRSIMISKGALGEGLPRRDIVLAPDQNVLLADPLLEQLFDCTSAMVRAGDLVALDGVEAVTNPSATAFVQVEFSEPEVLFCSGLAGESHSQTARYTKAPCLNEMQVRQFIGHKSN